MLKNFDEVIEKVRSIEPFTVSVAAAADKELLQADATSATSMSARTAPYSDLTSSASCLTNID